jgi:hypothetical protein
MSKQPERFGYPFTASTVLARRLVPLLLFTMGIGLFLLAGREFYAWTRPWAVLPAAALGLLCWLLAGYLFTLLPDVRAGDDGLRVRRWGLFWRLIPWESVAGVQETARVDLLGWVESFYTVYRWRTVAGRRRVRREWHRKQVRGFRFSGHIRSCDRLLARIEEQVSTSLGDEHWETMPRQRDWQRMIRRVPWVHIALFVSTLTVYVLTLIPGVLGGDVGELQFVPHILGLAHPTGTPFYVLLGKLWTMLPLGRTVAWRMNLLSAVSASLAVVIVYHHLHWRTQRVIPSLVAAMTLAFGFVFWEQATMADKYAFNALLVALVLHLALVWGTTRSPTSLNLLVLTYGLSLTHHRTMLLFAPTLLGYVWWHERGALWRDWRRLLRLAALFLAPLLFYLYLPWAESRNLPPGTWHPQTLSDWYHYIMDTGQIGYLYIDPADLLERLLFYAQTLQRDFTWFGLLLGGGGLLWQFYRRPADAVFLLTNFALHAFLAANHHLPRQWTFFIPSFIIFTLWIGEALGVVWMGVERVRSKWVRAGIALAVILAVVMLALPLASFRQRYHLYREIHLGAGMLDVWRQQLKQGYMGERMGQAIAGVEQDAVIVSDWEQATPLWYYQRVEGWRPDVGIVYPFERLEEAAASGRPLYVTRNHPELAGRWHLSSSGPLIALRSEPASELPPGATPLGIRLGDAFELAGVAYGGTGYRPGSVVPLTIYWQALSAPAHDYSVSLRLFDAAGQEVFKQDSQHPVLGTYPTSQWAAGEVAGDYYEIQLPPDLAPGAYQWGAILYRILPEGGWENLKVAGGEGEVAVGGTIEVQER